MATMPTELDAQKIAKNFILEIRITRLKQWRWRLWFAILLCRWAAKIAWIDITLISYEEAEGDLQVTLQSLCDPENQPHQWMNHPEELDGILARIYE